MALDLDIPILDPDALQVPGQIALEVRDFALACLAQSPFGAPTEAMVGHAEPPDGCDNALLVYWLRFQASAPGAGPAVLGGADVACEGFEWTGELSMFVIRGCAETVGATPNTALPNRNHAAGPVPEEDMALKLSVDAQIIMCAIAPNIQNIVAEVIGQPPQGCCLGYSPGDLVPFDMGGFAGWGWSFRIALGACNDCVDL